MLEYQEISDFFADMQLEAEQFDKILDFLEANNIDVLRITADDSDDEILLDVDDDCLLYTSISFGDYTLDAKAKLDNFGHQGDLYKVKTYKDITKLERNGCLLYRSNRALTDWAIEGEFRSSGKNSE